ncbi:unnamed protein product [Trichogramma brassicae]|uniref:Myosin tail domain-containing protein n=1 Tax=Trichogramma brassicae TaxID=86971 RepID=A0A6H5I6L1_9HYME|nr:unnamed protein product [Trichogramma brassicae]
MEHLLCERDKLRVDITVANDRANHLIKEIDDHQSEVDRARQQHMQQLRQLEQRHSDNIKDLTDKLQAERDKGKENVHAIELKLLAAQVEESKIKAELVTALEDVKALEQENQNQAEKIRRLEGEKNELERQILTLASELKCHKSISVNSECSCKTPPQQQPTTKPQNLSVQSPRKPSSYYYHQSKSHRRDDGRSSKYLHNHHRYFSQQQPHQQTQYQQQHQAAQQYWNDRELRNLQRQKDRLRQEIVKLQTLRAGYPVTMDEHGIFSNLCAKLYAAEQRYKYLQMFYQVQQTEQERIRQEKEILLRKVEKLNSEIKKLKKACEELKESRTDVMRELLEIKSENFQGELQSDLADETINKEGQDSRLTELRLELERLQAENAAEWGKRERLETEKILLERENKQLRNELREIKERPLDSPLSSSRKSNRPKSGCLDSPESTKQLQVELLETNRELSELKQSVAKLKKLLAEKTTELSHSIRRSEQYEVEVKRIRKRVDELKKELTTALEEVDAANLTIRRLKRTNENLQDELDDTHEKLDDVRRMFVKNLEDFNGTE